MITAVQRSPAAPANRARREAGLTLSEMMVSSAVFSLTVLGLVYCQMFGMRQDQLVQSKIGASEQARLSFNEMANHIRSDGR